MASSPAPQCTSTGGGEAAAGGAVLGVESAVEVEGGAVLGAPGGDGCGREHARVMLDRLGLDRPGRGRPRGQDVADHLVGTDADEPLGERRGWASSRNGQYSSAARRAAGPDPLEVGGHDGVVADERRRHVAPAAVVLREAVEEQDGRPATGRGAGTATVYLRRALEEPPADDHRAAVLHELGVAEATDRRHDASAAHLREALAATGDPTT